MGDVTAACSSVQEEGVRSSEASKFCMVGKAVCGVYLSSVMKQGRRGSAGADFLRVCAVRVRNSTFAVAAFGVGVPRGEAHEPLPRDLARWGRWGGGRRGRGKGGGDGARRGGGKLSTNMSVRSRCA